MTSIRSALVKCANDEWIKFGSDEARQDKYVTSGGVTTNKAAGNNRKETVNPWSNWVADYWLAIGSADYTRLVKAYAKATGRLDGTINIAWSAAFMSYIMQKAGAGTYFPYSSGHAAWIVKSIKNKQDGKLSASLVGYKPGEKPLAVGDLIGRPREPGVTYANAVKKGWFISHTDVVVEINIPKRYAYVIGGNVGQSVSRCKVKIDPAGNLVAEDDWFVHIENNIALPQNAAIATGSPAGVG